LAVLPIYCYEHDILRRAADPIDLVDGKADDEVRKLAADMTETMAAFDGLGLAAPQVGVSRRLFILHQNLLPEAEEPRAFINPELELDGEPYIDREGCLSLPEIFGRVKRYSRVELRATGLEGEELKLELPMLAARAAQHEFDHLEGILFVDHLTKGQSMLVRGRLQQLAARTAQGWLRRLKDDTKK